MPRTAAELGREGIAVKLRKSNVFSPSTRRRGGGEAALQILDQIGDILQADLQADDGAGRPWPDRPRLLQLAKDREALKATPGEAQAEQPQSIEESPRLAIIALQLEGEEAGRTAEI